MSEQKKTPPFFSVIVTSFNAGDKLKKTVESILAQTCRDAEIVVQDACSEDDSFRALDACLKTENHPEHMHVRLAQKKDKGIYDGMNLALQRAVGRYVYFLNCGDYLHDSEVLSKVKEEILKREETAADEGAKIFYGNVLEMRSGAEVAANPEMTDFALFRNIPCHQACFYDRRLFEGRAFDLRYKVRADYEHFLWAHYEAKADMICLPLLIADYEGGGFSETKEGREISKAEHRQITEQYMPPELVKKYRRRMILTLQPLREWLAHAPVTGALYNALKRRVYNRKT